MKKLKTVLLSTALIGLSSKALMGMKMEEDSVDWATGLASSLAGTTISAPSPYITALKNLGDYESDFQSILADTYLSCLVQGSILDQIKILHQLASIPESNRSVVRTMAMGLAGENSVDPQDLVYTMMHLNSLSSLQLSLSSLQLSQLQTTPLSITYSLETSLHDLTQQAVSVLPRYPLDATESDLTFLKSVFSDNTSLSLALLQNNIGTSRWRQMITTNASALNTNTLSLSGLLSDFYGGVLSSLGQDAQILFMQAFTDAAQAQVFRTEGSPLSNSDIETYANLWQLFSGYKDELFEGIEGAALRATLDLFDNENAKSNIGSLMTTLRGASFLGDDSSFNAALVSRLLIDNVVVHESSLSAAAQAKIFQSLGDSDIGAALHYLDLWNTFYSYKDELFEGRIGAELRATLDLFDNIYAKGNIGSLMTTLRSASFLGDDSSFNAALVSTLLDRSITSEQISPITSWINVDSASVSNTVQKILLAVGINANNLNDHVTGSIETLVDQLFDSNVNPAHLQGIATILNQTESIDSAHMTNKILMADFLISNSLTYTASSDTGALLLGLLRLNVMPKDLEAHAKVVLAQSLLDAEPNVDAGHIDDMLTGIGLHSVHDIVDPDVSALGYVFYANNQSAVDEFAALNPTLPFHEAIAITEKNISWGEGQVLDQYAYPILSYIEEVQGELLLKKKARYAILKLLQAHGILSELGIAQAKIVVNALLANTIDFSSFGIDFSSLGGISGTSNPLDIAPTTSAVDFLKGLKLASIAGFLEINSDLPVEDQKALVTSINKSVIFEELNLFSLISINFIFQGTSEQRALKLKEYLLAPLWPHYADIKARTTGYWSTAVDDFKNFPLLRIAYDAAVADGAICPMEETPAQTFFGSWGTLKTFLQDYVANGYANSYVISLLAATGRKDEIWDGFVAQDVDTKKQLVPAYARGAFVNHVGLMSSWADIWLVIHPLEQS